MGARQGRGAAGRAVLAAVLLAGTAIVASPVADAGTTEPVNGEISASASWQLVPAPSRSGSNQIYDVSCRTATRCVAVGDYTTDSSNYPRPLALELINGAWKSMSTPSFGQYSELYSVSCAAVDRCIAVGKWAAANGSCCTPLVLSLADGVWKRVPKIPVTSSWYTDLRAVSCPTITRCFVVGSHRGPGNSKTFAMGLANGVWSIMPSQNRNPTLLANWLLDVSCPSVTSCVAVGESENDAVASYTLALTLTNGLWKFAPSPRRGTLLDDNRFHSVSCTSATHCVAVGASRVLKPDGIGVIASRRGLIATLSSGTWTLHPIVEPGVDGDQYLFAVSCTSATRCVAAGRLAPRLSIDAAHVVELAGSSWSIVPLPDPPGDFEYLNGVSCRGTARCVAAGWTETDRLRPLILAS